MLVGLIKSTYIFPFKPLISYLAHHSTAEVFIYKFVPYDATIFRPRCGEVLRTEAIRFITRLLQVTALLNI